MTGTPDTAAAQLRRILLALPELADDQAHRVADVAARVGTDADTLLRDLRTLVTRTADEPAGFVEPVQMALDAEHVRLDAPGFFRRPMGLTAFELESLELGLATLRQELPAEEHATIDRARERLAAALTQLPRERGRASHAAGFEIEPGIETESRRTVQRCIAERRVLELDYQGARDVAPRARTVRPFGLAHVRGAWYLVAWCAESDALRVFRLDRVSAARATDDRFESPREFALDSVIRDGRVMSEDAPETLRVRYRAGIARWIAERETVAAVNADGSIDVVYPLANIEWAVSSALQYGAEAEVIEPAQVRERIVSALRAASAPE